MTAHTPATKASSVSALLASFSTAPKPPQPPAQDDFLAVILQALTTQPGGTDNMSSAQPAKDPPKPVSADASEPDVTAAGLLLAWLAPPLVALPQTLVKKGSTHNIRDVPLDQKAQTASARNIADAKPAKAAEAQKTPLASIQVPLAKEPQSEALPPSDAPGSGEKLPLAPVESMPPKEPTGKSTPSSGTSVANTSPRMSFIQERNEIAGRTEQKLPLGAVSAVSSADTGGASSDGGAKSSLDFSWHDTPPEPLTIIDVSAVAGSPTAPIAVASLDAPTNTTSATPLERLESMISHEALVIRQTGAQTLGVSLKLDSNTQLYLQLTTHNGSVQASVRCERGNFAPEDAQWAQLQQALARQNVSLQPMTGGSNQNFQQPSGQNSRQQQAALREDWGLAGMAVQPAQPRQQKEQNRSRNNWESWA